MLANVQRRFEMEFVKLEIEIPKEYYEFCKNIDSIVKLKQIRKEIANVIANGKVIEIKEVDIS